jgi:CubicO group peptidase (beta-lactamase class C family)
LSLAAVRAEELPRARPEAVGLSADKLGRIKSVVQSAIDKKQTAGVVVLVARRGKVAYLESFGKMDVAADTAMPADVIVRIYSMTKPVTTVAALMLYEEGKLGLDDPVAKHLPEFKHVRVYAGGPGKTVPAKREMTVRDLMRHTSGLTYGAFGNTPVDKLYVANKVGAPVGSLADLVSKLAKLPLQDHPGTRFRYSFSTDVLARIVEVVSGKPFDEFLRDRIFRPLDMHDTGFLVPAEKLGRFATAYRRGGKGGLEVADAPATSRFRSRPKLLSGGGGLVSTARDYARFCQMLLNGGQLQGKRLLREKTVRQMTTNQLPAGTPTMTVGSLRLPGLGFGLGVSVRLDAKTPKPDPAAGEYGWSGYASTYFWIAPKQELFAVVLQQLVPFNPELQVALKPVVYAAIKE